MSVLLNGSTSKLTASVTAPGAFPVAMAIWVKPVNNTQSAMPISLAPAGDSGTYQSIMQAADIMRAMQRDGIGSVAAFSPSQSFSAWSVYLAVYKSASERDIYYPGGVVSGTDIQSVDLTTFDAFAVGCQAGGFTFPFGGELAEGALWYGDPGQAGYDALAAGAAPETVLGGSLVDVWSLVDSTDLTGRVNGHVLTATAITNGTSHPISRGPVDGSASGGTGASTGSGTGGAATGSGAGDASASGGTGTSSGAGSGGTATGTVAGSFTTDIMVNNTGSTLATTAVSWTWLPSGRIGSLTGITPHEGTGTTDASGVLSVTGLPTGPGILLVAQLNTGATDDNVWYQAGSAA